MAVNLDWRDDFQLDPSFRTTQPFASTVKECEKRSSNEACCSSLQRTFLLAAK